MPLYCALTFPPMTELKEILVTIRLLTVLLSLLLSVTGASSLFAKSAGKAPAKRDAAPAVRKADSPKDSGKKPAARKTAARKATPRKAPSSTKQESPSKAGELVYKRLQGLVRKKDTKLLTTLQKLSQNMSWKGAKKETLDGNLRLLAIPGNLDFYLLRETSGRVYVLKLPKNKADLAKKSKSPYANLKGNIRHKMEFQISTTSAVVAGHSYQFATLTSKPKRKLLDRLFFIAIILLLFLTMVGMGMTLTGNDFARLASSPKGMLVGPLCQFGILPLLAFGIGTLFGFKEQFPFIFVGLLLVTSSPGGVTSNLMTYFAGGDVALSISLTALSTTLSIVLTPILLTLYASNLPNVVIPTGDVVKQILILVLVPLAVGMLIRNRAEGFALKSEKFFAGLGVFALLFLIIVGVAANLDKFADTTRYGFRFYLSIFLLTLAGMFFGALISKLFGVRNSQVRAISLETGLQNSSLAMTIAILLQDRMGDFYSSMFFTSGIFGLWMYVAGAFSIVLFKIILPLDPVEEATSMTDLPAAQ